MKVILTEKPSVARDIARVLGQVGRGGEGYIDLKNGDKVTWAFGHLAYLADPAVYDEKLKSWKAELLPFIPQKFELVKNPKTKKQFNIVARLFKQADSIICATDAGREGELIFRYIMRLAGTIKTPFERLWISSMTDSSIRQGFANLKNGRDYDSLAFAAKGRSEADWIVGLNLTRAMTISCSGGSRQVLSVGRVQTPVLAMLVERDNTIDHFVPEDYWQLVTESQGKKCQFTHEQKFSEQGVGEVQLALAAAGQLEVLSVEAKPRREKAPQLYDLTTLQREASRMLGLSADKTLSLVQKLYEAKALTYPRTDSRYLTKDMVPGVQKLVGTLVQNFAGAPTATVSGSESHVFNNAKVSDHHAIIPTGQGSVSSEGKAVYDLVLRRFLATFSPVCIKEVTVVKAQANTVPFIAKGVVMKTPGWRFYYGSKSDKEGESLLPPFVAGECLQHLPQLLKKQTQPPKRFSDDSILGAMETCGKQCDDPELREMLKERGLGTPATRAAIIEKLMQRKFAQRIKKQIVSTDLGKQLIATLPIEELKSAEMTGVWEARLNAMAQGNEKYADFMSDIKKFTYQATSQVLAIEGTIAAAANAAPARSTYSKGKGASSRTAQTSASAPQVACPRCGETLRFFPKGSGCTRECGFIVWREVCHKKLTDLQLQRLIQTGEHAAVKGFKKKGAKTTFSAGLRLEEGGKVRLDFG